MMLTILFPVLNERLRLESGITRTVEYLDSISFTDYEIIIVENNSTDEETFSYYETLEKHPAIKVVKYEGEGFVCGGVSDGAKIFGLLKDLQGDVC